MIFKDCDGPLTLLLDQEKEEAKEKKAEEKAEAKAKKDEEKQLAKSEKHKSLTHRLSLHRHHKEEPKKEEAATEPVVTSPVETPEERVALNDIGQPVRVPVTVEPEARPATAEENAKATRVEIPQGEQQTTSAGSSPTDKVSPTGKVKTWFKSRFSRGSKSDDDKPKDGVSKGFVGGHALTGVDSNNASTTSLDGRSASIRAIALAGRQRTEPEDASVVPITEADDVSPMSSSDSEDEFFDEARDTMGTDLSPPRHIQDPAQKKSHSPVRDSRFQEIL